MKPYRLYIFDLDGTLFRGNEAIPHAVETVAALRTRGALVRYLTNNSGLVREDYVAKLQRLGFSAELSEVYSSAIAAGRVLVDRGARKVFYVGEEGLAQTLAGFELELINEGAAAHGTADAVVAGICRSFTYAWLNEAFQQILNGALFIATNTDATYPLENGKVQPGAGAIVASIAACSGVPPEVVGKPNPFLTQIALQDARMAPGDCLVVGDRVETDLLSGQAAGCDTHLVLTGVAKTAPPGQSWSEDLRGLF